MIFSFSHLAFSQNVDREVFEATLGEKKAYAYSVLEKTFEEFLKLNYHHQTTLSERIKSYLTDIQNQNINWVYDENLSKSTLNLLEKSELRQDILLYKNESYKERFEFTKYLNDNCSNAKTIDNSEIEDDFEELIEIPTTSRLEEPQLRKEELDRQKIRDKFPQPNKNGRFYYALAKAQTNHEDVKTYVLLVTKYEESPSASLIASAFLDNFSNSELIAWENNLIMIVEIYLKSLISNEIIKK
ncbi:hypothetical protein ADICYQ_0587 [Cyclobacterium qasimii M12-11B]|uniref:Uncharacterized protein n=3 Tax=Cyclobacterium qasimii TaxID=1350429 RepID=S7VLQ0_9BACT|nr:hypothetical protein ADICYQ_0587 [Cyclobacterium qasimii M12-11B]GEO22770.1 hypothetical protein CQA01_33040 [Cyclobacterium qasimii]